MYIWLIVAVVLNLSVWLFNRYFVSDDVDQTKTSIFLSLSGFVVMLAGALITGETPITFLSLILGVIQGISFAIGYCMLVFHALKIGPIALTTLLNNMGMLGPIVIGMLFFSQPVKSPFLLAVGFILVIVTMILTSISSEKGQEGEGHRVTKRWFIMAFLGWLLSCFSLGAQYINSQLAPDCVYRYLAVTYITAAVILIGYALHRKNLRPTKTELKNGVILGLQHSLCSMFMFLVLARVPYIVYYPVSVASPVFILMLIGHFFYKDKMDRTSWVSMILGFAGIVLLALFS